MALDEKRLAAANSIRSAFSADDVELNAADIGKLESVYRSAAMRKKIADGKAAAEKRGPLKITGAARRF